MVLGVGIFLLWPSPIESRVFHSGPMPELVGPLAPNRTLEACIRISEGEIAHPDKLLIDEAGRIYAGDDAGRILRLVPDGQGDYSLEIYAEPGGRPMELDFDEDGNLIVANLQGSHFLIEPDGKSHRLPTLEGLPLGGAGVAVARDGVIYYGANTERQGSEQTEAFMSMLAARPTSELRAFDPRTGEITTLVGGLLLPVGVELSAKQDFVAVAEFFAYRVTRYWIRGPKAGTSDRLIENLPGVVDGLIRCPKIARDVEVLAFEQLDRYDAFQDNPWPLLYRELDERCPGSRFVLTLRPTQDWLDSVVHHFGAKDTPMREWIYGVGHPLGNEESASFEMSPVALRKVKCDWPSVATIS